MPDKIALILSAIRPSTKIIGIDGRGGSGKSTFARLLQTELAQSVIVQLDDFYSPEHSQIDRKRVIEQVLIPHSHGQATQYQQLDWESGELGNWVQLQADHIIILEGITALHPDFASYLDLKIWLDCSAEIALGRGLKRDREEYGLENETTWLEVWIPREKAYIQSFTPMERADLVVSCD